MPKVARFFLSVAFVILSVMFSSHAAAETYRLKSGQVFFGEVVAQDDKVIKLRTSQGLVVIAKPMLATTRDGADPGEPKTPPRNISFSAARSMSSLHVLFVGNSYIYTNDLPGVLTELSRSGGHELTIDSSANPGWKLEQHAQSTTTLSMIEQGQWNYVILQEQSALPVFSVDRRESMLPAVGALQAKARKIGAKTLLLMTWGRKDGLAEAGLRDYKDMQRELEKGYREVGNQLGISVVAVGTAWKNALAQKPYFPLWQGDGSHPAPAGTYLTACVLFCFLFGQSPEGLEFTAGLSPETALFLQKIAAMTVL